MQRRVLEICLRTPVDEFTDFVQFPGPGLEPERGWKMGESAEILCSLSVWEGPGKPLRKGLQVAYEVTARLKRVEPAENHDFSVRCDSSEVPSAVKQRVAGRR